MIFIGIDPGVSGGIAAIDDKGRVACVGPMPATDQDLFDALNEIIRNAEMDDDSALAALERVWSSPGWGHAGAFTFGQNLGAVSMALTANRIPYELVLPRTWQKAFGLVYPKDATGVQKKNITKARAQALFPGEKITHAIADALLIAEYCRRSKVFHHGEEESRPALHQDQRPPAEGTVVRRAAPADHGAGAPLEARQTVRQHRRRARGGQ